MPTTRGSVAVVALCLVLPAVPGAHARQAVAGTDGLLLGVTPSSGDDSTTVEGEVRGRCSDGAPVGRFVLAGPALPAAGSPMGRPPAPAPYRFTDVSISEVRRAFPGAFTADAAYQLVFRCADSSGVVRQAVSATLDYTAGGAGSWRLRADLPTRTVLTVVPGGNVRQGTPVRLTADVSPANGTDVPAGTVEFFAGGRSLGIDRELSRGGQADVSVASLPVGPSSLLAVYAGGAGWSGSSSAPVALDVTPVAARATRALLTVSPRLGPAHHPVTLTCAVSSGPYPANGTVRFLDGADVLAAAPLRSGTAAVLRTSALADGEHDLGCAFTGTPPYLPSTAFPVAALYRGRPEGRGGTGVITLATPFTAEHPLDLGVALLDQASSTYRAEAPFDDLVVTDTRPGQVGFSVFVSASPFAGGAEGFPAGYAGVTGLRLVPTPGGGPLPTGLAIRDTPPRTPGLERATAVLTYPAGRAVLPVGLAGVLRVDGLPTSLPPGRYTSTVTVTAG